MTILETWLTSLKITSSDGILNTTCLVVCCVLKLMVIEESAAHEKVQI